MSISLSAAIFSEQQQPLQQHGHCLLKMAGKSRLFCEYKIGGISDFLNDKNASMGKESETNELDDLFKSKERIEQAPLKQELPIEVVPPSNSSAKHRVDPLKDSNAGSNNTSVIGKKRKKIESAETNEPNRKKQRENRKKYKPDKKDNEEDDNSERLDRTIFVGNVPVAATRKELKSFFGKYGAIESVRLRSVPVAKPKCSKRLAILKKEFHSERDSMNAYVVFKSKDDAEKANETKGMVFKDFHIRVDMAVKKDVDNKLSVFVGNLPFNVQEEELRKHFTQCGKVKDVRIIRDKDTGIGKGFGYVTYEKKESVSFAIKLQNSELKGRKIRVFKSVDKDNAKRTFNKKKDRLYRMKDVRSKGKNVVKGQEGKFAQSKGNFSGKSRIDTKKVGKGYNKGTKKFVAKKGKGVFKKKK